MRPHPRIRKTVKWGGAVVTVLLVVVWIGSGWVHPGWRWASGLAACVSNGCLSIDKLDSMSPYTIIGDGPSGTTRSTHTIPTGWSCKTTSSFSVAWRGCWRARGTLQTFWSIPLWPSIGIVAAISAMAWGLDARGRRRDCAHLCNKCGYDLIGLAPGAACPECGVTAA